MKKIALIVVSLLVPLSCRAMELEAVLIEDIEANQRKVTPALLGEAFLDAYKDRIQARVVNQFTMAGGNASCGYQALHNALILSKLIFSKDEPEQVALRLALTKKKEKKALFGAEHAPWRKKIDEMRGEYDGTDRLTSDEIRVLSSENVIPTVKGLSHFFALGDIPWQNALKSDPLNFEDYDEQSEKKTPSDFRQFMRLYHQVNKNCVGIFIMYDGEPNIVKKTFFWLKSFVIAETDSSLSQASNHGHWHCIIVNKVNNEAQFILADSNNNASRLQDKRLNELIALLDRRPQGEQQLTTQNNLFTVRSIAAALIIAALLGTIAKKKLSQTSSSKIGANSLDGDAEEDKEI